MVLRLTKKYKMSKSSFSQNIDLQFIEKSKKYKYFLKTTKTHKESPKTDNIILFT